jgi:hypothetical protein
MPVVDEPQHGKRAGWHATKSNAVWAMVHCLKLEIDLNTSSLFYIKKVLAFQSYGCLFRSKTGKFKPKCQHQKNRKKPFACNEEGVK